MLLAYKGGASVASIAREHSVARQSVGWVLRRWGVAKKWPRPHLERFEQLYEPEPISGCWIWLGRRIQSRGTGEYGGFNADGRDVLAHRFAYEFYVGEIPDGQEIDHLCRLTVCVNPAHLEAVTHTTNLARGKTSATVAIRDGRCVHGHLYDEENTKRDVDGHRYCRLCRRDGARRRRASRRIQC